MVRMLATCTARDSIIIFMVNNNTSNQQYQNDNKSKLTYLKMGFPTGYVISRLQPSLKRIVLVFLPKSSDLQYFAQPCAC